MFAIDERGNTSYWDHFSNREICLTKISADRDGLMSKVKFISSPNRRFPLGKRSYWVKYWRGKRANEKFSWSYHHGCPQPIKDY